MKTKDVERLLEEYANTRHARLLLDEEAKKMKVAEDTILDKLTAAGVESGKYGRFSLQVSSKSVPRCTDWNLFHKYVLSSGNLDMLHKRLTESAVMARVEAGEYVPAIALDTKYTYKVSP